MRIILASLILSAFYTGVALAQIYVANSVSDSLTVIKEEDTVVVDLPMGSAPFGVAATPDGDFVYVANSGNGTVSVIQTSDNTVVDTVAVADGAFLNGIAVTPDGNFVYVTDANNGTVYVIQTSDNTVVATTDVGDSPFGVAADPTGELVFVANSGSNNVSILEAVGDFGQRTFPVDVGDTPIYVAAGDTGSDSLGIVVFVANQGSNTVSVIGDVFNEFPNIFSTTMDVGGSPTGIVATPDGVSVLVTNKDPNTLTQLQFDADSELGWPVTETFDTGDSPVAVAISSSPMLGGPGPESPMGGGGSSSDSCALASPGAAPPIPLYLLIPAFILISRFWRRRTN